MFVDGVVIAGNTGLVAERAREILGVARGGLNVRAENPTNLANPRSPLDSFLPPFHIARSILVGSRMSI